jgi:hypothetical protein
MPFTPPTIIGCDEWGAESRQTRTLNRRPTKVVVHHTATDNTDDLSLQQAYALARSIQRDHINRGYGDSGQHFTITRRLRRFQDQTPNLVIKRATQNSAETTEK